METPLQHDPRREGFGVFSIRRTVCALPSRVRLDDYDYSKPLLGLVADSTIAGGIGGEVYEYGTNYTTPDEGRHLAHVRAAEIGARREVYACASSEPALFAGARVLVAGTPRGDLGLLVTELETTFEVRDRPDATGPRPVLENTFRAIPRGVPYRPERCTPKPRVHGMLTGVIDAEVRDAYASLDDHGRYRVKLLFDASGPKEGHASLPIRMAQSHAGPGYGMHFPLRPGVEVLIAFVNGDPDRPVIAGCVPNVLTPSPVTRQNGTRNVIRTGSNNEINLDDQKGGERIKLSTPRHNTVLQLGAANAPEEGIHLTTDANFTSITKSGSALVSGGNALLSAKHAFIGGDVISLAGKTVPERVKAIMEMGEAVAEILAEVAGVIGDTATQPTLAVLSAEVEKAKGEVEGDEKDLADAEQATPRDEAKIAEARRALDEKKERLAKLEEVEERVEQATEAAKSAAELVVGGATDVTKLVSLVCDVFSEIERIKAVGEVSGLFAASQGNTILAGGKPDLGLKMERPYNLVASDKVAAVAGEDIGFLYGKDATVYGGSSATFTSEQTLVAGIKNVEVTSRDKIWLHTSPASLQLLPRGRGDPAVLPGQRRAAHARRRAQPHDGRGGLDRDGRRERRGGGRRRDRGRRLHGGGGARADHGRGRPAAHGRHGGDALVRREHLREDRRQRRHPAASRGQHVELRARRQPDRHRGLDGHRERGGLHARQLRDHADRRHGGLHRMTEPPITDPSAFLARVAEGRAAGIHAVGLQIGGGSLALADLSSARFERCRFVDVSLRGGNLSATRFEGCRLEKVDLTAADLSGADLSTSVVFTSAIAGADLRGAHLCKAMLAGADLREVQLRGARLEQCLLREANAAHVDFRGCSLVRSRFPRADLEGAILDGVDARQICLANATLTGAILSGVSAREADFTGANLDRADLHGGDFTMARFAGARMRRASVRGARLGHAFLEGADLRGTSFAFAFFEFADLSHCDLALADLTEANLKWANLHRTRLEDAILAGAKLGGARRTDPDRSRAEDFRTEA
ncbi:MAG: type VI secretion system tip protein VgrG [Myxococcales bacterium]|nr:type VI secretion system tip protein VgrG [Myxococcales bacterium]